MLPYVGFPLLRECSFRCPYCGVGGEAAASNVRSVDLKTLKQRAEICLRAGINKFRLTGGEPLLHPEIAEILMYFSRVDATCTLNTAAFLITRKKSIFEKLGPNLRFICSLDALDEAQFDYMTGSRDWFQPTLEGIEYLSNRNLLKRINMVVVRDNIESIPEMIQYCANIGCDLKISDVAGTPNQFEDLGLQYADLTQVEERLSSLASKVTNHPYSQYYGIPSKIYNVNGVEVTVKSSVHGSRFALSEPCSSCSYFPCEEGLYFINILPDGTVSACRQNMFHLADSGDLEGNIRKMIDHLNSGILKSEE